MPAGIRVRMLQDKVVDGVLRNAGDVIELPGTSAAVLLRRGLAERAELRVVNRVETPEKARVEAADDTRAVEEVVEVMEAAEPELRAEEVAEGDESASAGGDESELEEPEE